MTAARRKRPRRRIKWVGTHALLIEMPMLDDVLALHAKVVQQPWPGQLDAVPAARTLLIKYDSHRNAAQAERTIAGIDAPPIDPASGRTHDIEVIYDGADLHTVGELTGLGAAGVVQAHGAQPWRAAFSGFAPGFVYLVGADERLAVPRRDSPRTAVPTGAVALAGRFSAIYPRQSPGGWQLIGRTNARVWDLDRDAPALIQPGDTVRFVAVERFSDETPPDPPDESPVHHGNSGAALEIVSTGLQSLVQDLGRPGLSRLGVPESGAADGLSARQANRLVGNRADAALIETLLGGLRLKARGELVLARTGARGPAHIDGPGGQRAAPAGRPFALREGETLELDGPHAGLRSYVAVRGGINTRPVLGSRASDTISAIGTPQLQAGHMLPVAAAPPSQVVGAPEPPVVDSRGGDDVTHLRVVLGPRDDWFDADSIARFARTLWRVSPQSNRIGVRLEATATAADPQPLRRCRDDELDSEGMVPGAIQVPPSGLPVVFLRDHPVTGGYPVIAVVVSADLHRVAQLAPGDALRFVVVAPDGAATHPAAKQDNRP